MKSTLNVILLLFFIFGCKTENNEVEPKTNKSEATGIRLNFLDDYNYPENKTFKNTVIGGLSGVDYANKKYYFVVDDAKQPRIYKADIQITHKKIDTVIFNDVINFDEKVNPFYAENHLDLESIIVEKNNIIVSSEGKIYKRANPAIFKIDTLGNFVSSFQLPKKFLANSTEKPINNGVFEGLTKSFDKKGFWSAMEFPLTSDGIVPEYPTTNSPVRFTYYDSATGEATKEFLYELSPLPRENKGNVNLNGLTDVLEYKKDHFFVIERTYQSGYKEDENIVRIYEAIINSNTTNVLAISSAKHEKYYPMQKRLLLDFTNIKDKLASKEVDNIEGITFGPTLSNGNKSLLLISDDNFQIYGKQLNQFILLEIIE